MADIKVTSLAVSFILLLFEVTHADELLQSVQGSAGRENFTYYKLQRHGRLRIELTTLSGDADLYISDETQNPTVYNYKQVSQTCGNDILEIPNDYIRPVGIGIYGYPSYESSKYLLSIYLLPKVSETGYEELMANYYNYEELATGSTYSDHGTKQRQQSTGGGSVYSADSNLGNEEEEESFGSVIWHILLTLLKVVFEVIL